VHEFMGWEPQIRHRRTILPFWKERFLVVHAHPDNASLVLDPFDPLLRGAPNQVYVHRLP